MAAFENWESQIHARANETLARRASELKAEIERLQGAISEIGSRMAEQDRVTTDAESSGVIEEIKRWFDERAAKVEMDFKTRLEEATANARLEAEIRIVEMREQLEASRMAEMAASQISSRSFEMFKAAIEDIDSQRTQSDTLAALVRHAAEFAPRVVFFVLKSGDAVGWKARGFENGLSDETVKFLTVPAQKPALLREAITSLRIATSNTQSMADSADSVSETLGIYGNPTPERAIAIPLIVMNKAVAVLYADSGAHSPSSLNTAAAESLTRIASKTIEVVLSRRSAENARLAAQSAGATENSPAAPHKTDGKAMGAAIQQTPAQLTVQPMIEPAVQMDSVRVESELKQDSEREISPEIPEESPKIEQIDEFTDPSPSALDRVTIERRRTQELPLPLDKNFQIDSRLEDPADMQVAAQADLRVEARFGATADEGLRQAEAQLPEPAYIETEPEAGAEPQIVLSEDAVNFTRVSGKLRIESPPAPDEVEQQPVFSAPALSAPMSLSDLASSQVEAPPVPPDISPFSPPPAPPVFSSPTKPPKQSQSLPSVSGSETEQRAHNDARRFARLLVSEIKLYNAAKVNDGRRNFDLYERLKDEIDRNRKVYDKRVSPTVAARFDYFYEELVQTLAEGDPAKLGKDCPGPVALA